MTSWSEEYLVEIISNHKNPRKSVSSAPSALHPLLKLITENWSLIILYLRDVIFPSSRWQVWGNFVAFQFVFICHSGRVCYDFFSSWFYFKKFSSVIDSCGLINLGNFVKANNFQKLFSDSFFDCVLWSSFVKMTSLREFCGFPIRVYLSLWKSLLWFLFKLILF